MKNIFKKTINVINHISYKRYKSLIFECMGVMITMYGSYRMYVLRNEPAFSWTLVTLLMWGMLIFARCNWLSAERKIEELTKEKKNEDEHTNVQ